MRKILALYGACSVCPVFLKYVRCLDAKEFRLGKVSVGKIHKCTVGLGVEPSGRVACFLRVKPWVWSLVPKKECCAVLWVVWVGLWRGISLGRGSRGWGTGGCIGDLGLVRREHGLWGWLCGEKETHHLGRLPLLVWFGLSYLTCLYFSFPLRKLWISTQLYSFGSQLSQHVKGLGQCAVHRKAKCFILLILGYGTEVTAYHLYPNFTCTHSNTPQPHSQFAPSPPTKKFVCTWPPSSSESPTWRC